MESTRFSRIYQKLQALSKKRLMELLSKMNNNNIEEDIEAKSKEQLINLIMIETSNLNPNQLESFYNDIEVIENSTENKIEFIMDQIGQFRMDGIYLVAALLIQEIVNANQNGDYESGDGISKTELLKTIEKTLNKLSTDQIANIAGFFNQNIDLAKEILYRLNGIKYIVPDNAFNISSTTLMDEGKNLKNELNKR